MRRFAVAATALLACCAPLSPASADPPSAAGLTCGLASFDDPTGTFANPDTQIGELFAGPVVVADLPFVQFPPLSASWDVLGNPASATVTCSVQVDGRTYCGSCASTSASASGEVVVVLLPPLQGFVGNSYSAGPTNDVFVCTTWQVVDANGSSATHYFDAPTGRFVTTPSAARCAPVYTHTTCPLVVRCITTEIDVPTVAVEPNPGIGPL